MSSMTQPPSQLVSTMSDPTRPLSFYNYRTRQLEPFVPMGETVGLYTCGPTVYAPVHIGNLRTFIFEDVLRRVLKFAGYPVKQVMNLTDVDDKTIRGAKQAKLSLQDYTRPFTERFFEDVKKLAIEPAEFYPAATEHIDEMIRLIGRLFEAGNAYERAGSVYFAIDKFPDYGKLSGVDLAGLAPGARVDQDEYDKDQPGDFALWKAAQTDDEAVGAVWDAPWGRGRPGWHIECSALALKFLGESFDIHTGGIDLLFPHHEDEVAQVESLSGQPFARFFLEAEHLLTDEAKMAKSLGNVTTLAEIEEHGFDPLDFRYLTLTAHYRSKLHFSWESLAAARETRLVLVRLQYRPVDRPDQRVIDSITERLFDDLDTPGALAILHREANPALWEHFDTVLGLGLTVRTIDLSADLHARLDEREEARQRKDFTTADTIRDEFALKGYEIDDTSDGPVVVPKQS